MTTQETTRQLERDDNLKGPALYSIVHALGGQFASRAEAHDADDTFVAENFAALKTHRLLATGVPGELGGGDASIRELSDMLRLLAHYCGSTALAFSMHTHQVAMPAWRWRHEGGFGEALLRRVAAENIVLVSSGGSDWVESSGRLEKADGGYRMYARKVFASASPAGDLLVTSAPYDDPATGPSVLHFALPLKSPGVRIEETWRAMGMRGTGSHDVVIDGAFIPEAAISGRRPQGKWGPFHLVSMIALPLIYSVYVGIAEAARDQVLARATAKRDDAGVRQSVAEMEVELRKARMALTSAIDLAESAEPGPSTTNEALILRTLAGEAAIRTVEKAMEVAGGAGFYRANGLERLFRDVQGARYHPLTTKRQLESTGSFTLGLPIE